MTTPNILAILASYGFVSVLLVLVLLRTSIPVLVRLMAALATSAMMLVVYMNAGELRGWPSDSALPERFQLHWFRVVEPSQLRGDPGSIFLWIEELDEKNFPSGFPRAFQVPFDEALAEKLAAIQTQIAQGEDIAGRMSLEDPDRDTAERLAEKVQLEQTKSTRNGGFTGERVQNFDPAGMTFDALRAPLTPDKPVD